MRTDFSPEQLADPDTARSNQILRSCVHCGFCTATCPTYQILGDELDSPRGRIYLIKEMLENDRPADTETVTHVDRCLSCLACMTTCPSGVHYMHLVDHARAHIERTYRRPWRDRALRRMLAFVLPYPRRFRAALRLARIGRPLAGLMPDRRLAAMLRLAPDRTAAPEPLAEVYPAQGLRRRRVGLLAGCAQQVLDTDINAATIRLLTRLGCEVVVPRAQGCCGALTHHMGRTDHSHAAAARNIRAFLEAAEDGGLDAIVVNTSGCGTTVKDYGHMLRTTDLARDAARVSALARDVTEVLAEIARDDGPEGAVRADPAETPGKGGIAGTDAPAATPHPSAGLRVAYHAACSLQHGQKVRAAPKTLLTRAGFEVVEPADAHLCCGSAGTYNLMQPELSEKLRDRKVATIEARSPQIVAAGNIGCMVQIAQGTAVPVVHTVELLDWATGGPRPAKLPADLTPPAVPPR
ncbi:glycolate oxidase iron-sulfur subunit [Mesobaculum littorinae]|uniref:Glycolate oxidase iron-sulfur subunit n=1 Tax=Mesobaculum littorinae TaxID=2486419 RepID=A0A438ADZ9_9RHOB|nr:glycolate oxidase subunit GlcF [Mesobaculum littorinae]RVV96895.1 glycolate oxidase iron-sulfur subunit [Mesobaculum littorinae]